MQKFQEGRLEFEFPDTWVVNKYDDSSFYRNKFSAVSDSKAVDFVVVPDNGRLILLEVKDYRGHALENKDKLKTGELVEHIVRKVRDTIAGLYAAALWNNDELKDLHKEYIKSSVRTRGVECVLFMQEDRNTSRLHRPQRRAVNQLDLLKKKLKPFNVKCALANLDHMPSGCAWSTANAPAVP